MTTHLDARGLACPQPVLMAKQTVDEDRPARLTVRVDNEAAVENVSRFLGTQGYDTRVTGQAEDFTIDAAAGDARPAAGSAEEAAAAGGAEDRRKILVFIPTDRMGFGDDELGRKLLTAFIKTLGEMGDELWRIVLVNNGVKLTIEGSPVLDMLREYDRQGIAILVCGTCLSHFDLLEAKQVGETTNMLDIVTAMQLSDKVIRP